MSSTALSHLIQPPSTRHRHTTSEISSPRKKGSLSTGHLSSMVHPASTSTISTARAFQKGHALIPATCSRLRLPCETCQHTVHKHSYLYCAHCPVVCHNRDTCIKGIPRACPSQELGIQGWGEGRQQIKFMRQSTIDLEEVFLSGMLGLQSNKCFECGQTLNPNVGHEYAQTNGSSKKHTSSSDEPSEDVHPAKGAHKSKLPKSLSHRKISPANVAHDQSRIRICHFTGKYYCNRCHWNNQWYIPGSIILLNDASLQPVSRSAYLKLRVLWDSAIYRIPPYWHKENQEAAEVFQIRNRLHQLLRFTLICPIATAVKECSEMSEPTHLLGYPHHLRMRDVVDVVGGNLYPRLKQILDTWTEHINTCGRCLGETNSAEMNEVISMCDFPAIQEQPEEDVPV